MIATKDPSKKHPVKRGRTIEQLHHFRCGTCGKWWSIGDAPKGKNSWFCPWCGTKDNFGVKR